MRIAAVSLAVVMLVHVGAAAAQPAIATGSNDARARALYFDARTALNKGHHARAVALLDQAIKLLGERKRRLMPILVDALRGAGKFERAAREATTFLAMKPVRKTAAYKRIAQLLPQLQKTAAAEAARRAADKRRRQLARARGEQTAWQYARRSNNSNGYRVYIQRFPHGAHLAEARRLLHEAEQRETKARLDRERRQREQRQKYERQRKQRELRYKLARDLKKEAEAARSSTSLYFTGGILALIGGGAAAVLLEDTTPRIIGGVVVAGGAVLLYLGQSRANKARRMERDADDYRRGRKPLPDDMKLSVAPWLGPKRALGIAFGGRFR